MFIQDHEHHGESMTEQLNPLSQGTPQGEEDELLDEEVRDSLEVLDAMAEEKIEQEAPQEEVASPAPPTAGGGDPRIDTMRNEISELRKKVRALEEALEVQELEFSERLLKESTRAREAVAERQKASQWEQDATRLEGALEREKAKNGRNIGLLEELRGQLGEGKEAQDGLSGTVARLEGDIAAAQAVRAEVEARMVATDSELREMKDALSASTEQRREAREVLAATMKLLDEMVRSANSVD